MTFEATYLGSNGWFIKFKKTNLIIDPWLNEVNKQTEMEIDFENKSIPFK